MVCNEAAVMSQLHQNAGLHIAQNQTTDVQNDCTITGGQFNEIDGLFIGEGCDNLKIVQSNRRSLKCEVSNAIKSSLDADVFNSMAADLTQALEQGLNAFSDAKVNANVKQTLDAGINQKQLQRIYNNCNNQITQQNRITNTQCYGTNAEIIQSNEALFDCMFTSNTDAHQEAGITNQMDAKIDQELIQGIGAGACGLLSSLLCVMLVMSFANSD